MLLWFQKRSLPARKGQLSQFLLKTESHQRQNQTIVTRLWPFPRPTTHPGCSLMFRLIQFRLIRHQKETTTQPWLTQLKPIRPKPIVCSLRPEPQAGPGARTSPTSKNKYKATSQKALYKGGVWSQSTKLLKLWVCGLKRLSHLLKAWKRLPWSKRSNAKKIVFSSKDWLRPAKCFNPMSEN